jgi:tetratricopeptide (TPR) repeat protein
MRLELIQPIFGDSAGHLDLRSGSSLSWSEHNALVASAAGSMATAQETARVRHTLEQLRYDVQDVTQAVETLQSEIGLQLQDQTRLMIRQVELLAQIAETLRTPARTRAAERISDAGELLRRERYERALTLAIQAIDDDPNNPAGFLAAAWASLGIDNVEQARDFFREATQASDGDQRQSALRKAVRLTFLLEGPQNALKELGNSREQLSPAEEGATDFDRAVYFSKAGESAAAAECIRKASHHDSRFCLMALTDPILSRDATVAETASEQLRAIQEIADPVAAEFRRAHARYMAVCKEIEDLGLAGAVWKWRERRDKVWQSVLRQLSELPYYGLDPLVRAQANARKALAVVDEDERALAERRAEEVLNEHLAREFDKGWWVVKRWKLHAAVGKATKSLWWGESYGVREVGLDPSGKIISTKVRARRDASYNGKYFMFSTSGGDVAEGDMPQPGDIRAVPARCEYCGCVTWRNLNICNAGELELFS